MYKASIPTPGMLTSHFPRKLQNQVLTVVPGNKADVWRVSLWVVSGRLPALGRSIQFKMMKKEAWDPVYVTRTADHNGTTMDVLCW